jgi:hypothetical protein
MSKRRLPTEKEASKLREMHKQGIAKVQMQKHFNIGTNTLVYWHTHLGLQVKQGNIRKRRVDDLSEVEEAEFIKYYAKKPTQEEVIKKYNIGVPTFDKWLKQLGLEKHLNARNPEFGNAARLKGDRHIKSMQQREQEEDSKPFVSIASRFRNLNGQNCTNLNPHR